MRTLLSYADAVAMVPIVSDTVPIPSLRHAVSGLVSGTGLPGLAAVRGGVPETAVFGTGNPGFTSPAAVPRPVTPRPPHWSPGCCPRAGRVLRLGGIAPGRVPASARRRR